MTPCAFTIRSDFNTVIHRHCGQMALVMSANTTNSGKMFA